MAREIAIFANFNGGVAASEDQDEGWYCDKTKVKKGGVTADVFVKECDRTFEVGLKSKRREGTQLVGCVEKVNGVTVLSVKKCEGDEIQCPSLGTRNIVNCNPVK